MNITTRKFSDHSISSNAKDFYSEYWTDERSVSQRTSRLNNWIIETFLPDMKGKSVLEVGVGGEGGLILNLSQNNKVVGVDASSSAVRNCGRHGVHVTLCDVSSEKLPFNDSGFGCVIALEVMEHLANPQLALEEIRRVLCDNGLLLIAVPSRWSYHWPRCFYPELIYNNDSFVGFLFSNEFSMIKSLPGVVPCNGHRSLPEQYKSLSTYYLVHKIGALDSRKYYESGLYFWNLVDDFGMRIDPITAIDMFRKSYRISETEIGLLMLPHALLYRVINKETEEFKALFQKVLQCDSAVSGESKAVWAVMLAEMLLEAYQLGVPLVGGDEMKKVWDFADKNAVVADFCRCLKIHKPTT